ncbi:MAG: hypothetical protein K6360_08855, partial [Deltaproteobacteria bacterium]
HTADPLAPENGNDSNKTFPMNPDYLGRWKERQCPVRSSERWQSRQRELKHMPSLPDVRHRIALYLMKMLM